MDQDSNKKHLRSVLLPFALLPAVWVAGCAHVAPPAASTPEERPPVAATNPAPQTPIMVKAAPARPAAEATAAESPKVEAEADSAPTTADSVTVAQPEEFPDIWARIRRGFGMKKLDSPLVGAHEQWFANNPEYMGRMMERARLYLHHIVAEVEKRGIPTEIALLPAIESAYQPYAYSRARAAGLWQFIAPTGRLYGLKMNWWYDGRRDVMASTQAALDYLEKLYNEFDGDWHLALAAYNAGEGKINRMIEYNRARGKPTDYQSLKLRRETINYVPKLQAMANIIANPEKYGVQLADIPNKPYFARVETDSQIDLGVVAKLVDMPVSELQVINPGFTRFATDPNGPHHLLVPADKKDALVEGLSNLAKEDRIQYRHHEVRRGDTLHEIARRYGITVEAIRAANNLHSNLLRAGQDLLIPISTRPLQPVIASAPRAQPVAASAASKSQPVLHLVRAGETLWGIARRYNVLVEQIRQWNLLGPQDVLKLGQKLRIWPTGGPSAAVPNLTPNS
jgi:membrane-bound lytic murein transglycosylase D